MDDEKFWAELEVHQNDDGLWEPVLIVGKGEGEAAEQVRVALTGAYPLIQSKPRKLRGTPLRRWRWS